MISESIVAASVCDLVISRCAWCSGLGVVIGNRHSTTAKWLRGRWICSEDCKQNASGELFNHNCSVNQINKCRAHQPAHVSYWQICAEEVDNSNCRPDQSGYAEQFSQHVSAISR